MSTEDSGATGQQQQQVQQPPQQPPQQTPAPQQVQPPQQQVHSGPTSNSPSPGDRILAALEALPERLANTLTERAPQQRQPQTQQRQSTSDTGKQQQQSGGQGGTREPGNPQGLTMQQRFVKWWGG